MTQGLKIAGSALDIHQTSTLQLDEQHLFTTCDHQRKQNNQSLKMSSNGFEITSGTPEFADATLVCGGDQITPAHGDFLGSSSNENKTE